MWEDSRSVRGKWNRASSLLPPAEGTLKQTSGATPRQRSRHLWVCNPLRRTPSFRTPTVIQQKMAVAGKLPLFKGRVVLGPMKLPPVSEEEASFSLRETSFGKDFSAQWTGAWISQQKGESFGIISSKRTAKEWKAILKNSFSQMLKGLYLHPSCFPIFFGPLLSSLQAFSNLLLCHMCPIPFSFHFLLISLPLLGIVYPQPIVGMYFSMGLTFLHVLWVKAPTNYSLFCTSFLKMSV